MTSATKQDAGIPHVRFDDGDVASAKPRHGSLLCRNKGLGGASCRGLVGGLLAVMFVLPSTALSMDYNEPAFLVDNPGGSSSNALSECVFTKITGGVELSSTYAEFNAATSGTLVKRGVGWVSITENHAGFSGDVHVESGVLYNNAKTGLGALTSGGVHVSDGATLYQDVTTDDLTSCTRKIYITGEGVSDLGGALYVRHRHSSNNRNWMFLGGITLTGNAVIVVDSAKRPSLSYWQKVDLAGHDLRIMAYKGLNKTQIQFNGPVTSSGTTATTLVADNLQLDLASEMGFLDTDGVVSELVLTNKTRVVFRTAGGTRTWRLRVDDPEQFNLYGTSNGIGERYMTNLTLNSYNKWQGPVVLNRDMLIRKFDETSTEKYYPISLMGPVSGKGGIKTGGDLANQRNLIVSLGSADNTFEGGVSLYMGALNLHAPTALPPNGGPAVITNGVLGLCVDGDYTLPNCIFEGDCRILGTSGAQGQAKSVTKKGAGTLYNGSLLGMAKLDVQGGTYRQSARTWAGVAGLNEYRQTYETLAQTTTNFKADDPQVEFSAKRLMMPASHMNDPVWDPTPNYTLFVYRGYVWNREATNVTWALASLADDGDSLRIDGVEVAKSVKYNAKTSTFVITPGPHTFEYRIYNDTSYRGALDRDIIRTFDGTAWTYTGSVAGPKGDDGKPDYTRGSWHGWLYSIMYKTGEVTYFDTDYQQFKDPGDGSLFTTSTNMNDVAVNYGEMKFAAGTTFDMGNWPATAAELVGMPTVVNGDFSVTGRWTFAAADVGVNRLTLDGKLMLGESATVKIEGDISGLTLPVVVAEAQGGISMPKRMPVTAGNGNYLLKQTSDTEISLVDKPGLILIVE